MSKPRSGLFHGTIGDRAITSAEQIIAARTAGLDLHEHPITQKELSSKRMKQLSAKVVARTATKAEYQAIMWNKRFRTRRDTGINEFWKQERYRIITGQQTTRSWSPQQIADILNKHRPKFKGKTMAGHHAYSASRYPHLANRAEVIFPVTHTEHYKGWHGGNYRRSLPGRRIRSIIEF
ncbi:MAG: hypothetical protein E7317_00455 [Clostridiales bacterium]|nr:hypothetical protein [Clostridiales bacterium]